MVISGKNLDQDKSDRQQRLVSSLGQDLSYNTTNGQWMMPKQLGLGFAMQGKEFLITSPLTKVPPDWKDLLHHNSNKEQIIRLLLNEWKKDKYAPRLHTVNCILPLEQSVSSYPTQMVNTHHARCTMIWHLRKRKLMQG